MQHFDFTVTRESKRPSGKRGKTLRLLLLFCTVAAVTALAIWLILPKEKTSDHTSPAVPKTVSGGNDVGIAEKPAGLPAEKTADNPVPDSGKSPELPTAATENKNSSEAGQSAAVDKEEKVSADTKPETAADQKTGNAKFDPSIRELFNQTRQLQQALTSGAWKSARYAVTHTVSHGDNLTNLCGKYRNTRAFVQHFNDIANANAIALGQKITFIRADKWQLTISRKNGFLKVDRIVGKEVIPFAAFECYTRTKGVTRSDLVISQRRKNPGFVDRHGRKFASGDAGNPYGEILITLAKADRPDRHYLQLSIHGRGDAPALETSIKGGATALRPEDILLLYYLVPEGSPVRIVE